MPYVMPQRGTMDRVLNGSNYKRLLPRSGRRDEIIFDHQISSLALRVYASGEGRWLVQYRPRKTEGRLSRVAPKRFVIGDRRFVSLSQAREIAIQTLAAIGRGTDPLAERVEKRRRERSTVSSVLCLYEEDLERRRVVNRKTIASTLKRGFHGCFGADIGSIKLADVIEIMDQIGETIWSRRCSRFSIQELIIAELRSCTRNRSRKCLGRVSPTAQLTGRAPRGKESRSHPYRRGNQGCLVSAKRRNDSFGRIIRFLLLSGARRGEGAGLQRGWVKDRSIELPANFTKQARGHSIPRSTGIDALLKETPHRGTLLWPSERRVGGASSISGWSDLMPTLIKQANVAPFTPHDLRRTFRTWAEQQGIRDSVAEAALGHVDEKTLKRVYSRPAWQAELADLFERWSQHIEAVVGEPFLQDAAASCMSPAPEIIS